MSEPKIVDRVTVAEAAVSAVAQQADFGEESVVSVARADIGLVLQENARLRGRVGELQSRMSEMVVERQRASRYGGRDQRQRVILSWALRVFGAGAGTLRERALRLVEEAIEAAQSAGLSLDLALRIVHRVYDRPPGDLRQELGGVAVTLAAFCEAAHLSADEVERDEMERVLAVPEEHFRARQSEKAEAGLGVAVESSP